MWRALMSLRRSCAHAPARPLAPCGRRGNFLRRRRRRPRSAGRAVMATAIGIGVVNRMPLRRRGLATARPRGFCGQPGILPERRTRTRTWRWWLAALLFRVQRKRKKKGRYCDQLCAVGRLDLKDLAAYSRRRKKQARLVSLVRHYTGGGGGCKLKPGRG